MSMKLKVPKIKCMGCVNAVKEGLLKLDGIYGVDVDLDTKIVTVDSPAENREKIESALREIGYPAE